MVLLVELAGRFLDTFVVVAGASFPPPLAFDEAGWVLNVAVFLLLAESDVAGPLLRIPTVVVSTVAIFVVSS